MFPDEVTVDEMDSPQEGSAPGRTRGGTGHPMKQVGRKTKGSRTRDCNGGAGAILGLGFPFVNEKGGGRNCVLGRNSSSEEGKRYEIIAWGGTQHTQCNTLPRTEAGHCSEHLNEGKHLKWGEANSGFFFFS